MDSPFGIGYGLGQMGAGAMQGLVAANHENRTRDLRDRSFGLQENQDAREQALADMRQETYQRGLQQQDAELQANIDTFNRAGDWHKNSMPVETIYQAPALPPDHPDVSTPSDQSADEDASSDTVTPGVEAPVSSKSAMGTEEGIPKPVRSHATGLVPVRPLAPAGTIGVLGAVTPGVAKVNAQNTGKLGNLVAQGKASNFSDPDALLTMAQQHQDYAAGLAKQMHEDFDASGLDPKSPAGKFYINALVTRSQPLAQAAMQKAQELAHQANDAREQLNSEQAWNYIRIGRNDLAQPYLEATWSGKSKAALFAGSHPEGNGIRLAPNPDGTPGRLMPMNEVYATLRATPAQLLDVFKQNDLITQKQFESQIAQTRAEIMANKARPWNSEERIAQLSRIEYPSQSETNEYATLTNMRRDNSLAVEKQAAQKISGYQRAIASVNAQLVKDPENAILKTQQASLTKQLNDLGDFSMGTASMVPDQVIYHWYKPNEEVPEHYEITTKGLTPPPPADSVNTGVPIGTTKVVGGVAYTKTNQGWVSQ